MHKNFNYATMQNAQNIDEIQKVGIEIKLPIPNFNLYRFIKVNVVFNSDTPSLTSTDINHRLSGQWLVLNIRFVQIGNDFCQYVSLVKRELDLSKDELDREPKLNSKPDSGSGTVDPSSQDTGQLEAPTNATQSSTAAVTHSGAGNFDQTVTFKNATDLDNYFSKFGTNGFSTWFNKYQATTGAFAKTQDPKSGQNFSAISVTSDSNWKIAWNTINTIFGKSTCNLVEFLCMNTIMLNETGGKFNSVSEGVNSTSAAKDPGIAYAFDGTSHLSYNTLSTNKTAQNLFRDADYKAAHMQKPYGGSLANTTDARWAGKTFPIGFSGASDTSNEVSSNVSKNGFISEADFFKYRGRGYIQLTGRANYNGLVLFVIGYTGNNSKILSYKQKWSQYGQNTDKILSISTNADWDDLFQNTDSIINSQSIYVHSVNSKYQIIDASQGEAALKKSIRNVASKIGGSGATFYIDLFENRVNQQLSWMKTNYPT